MPRPFKPSHPPTKEEMTLILACCIRRARKASSEQSGDRPITESSEDEIYWHTREACLEVARQHKIFWPEVVRAVEHGTIDLLDSEVEERSASVWFDVMNPILLCREVMES